MKALIALALIGIGTPAVALPSKAADVEEQIAVCARYIDNARGLQDYVWARYTGDNRLMFLGRCLAFTQGKVDGLTAFLGRPLIKIEFSVSDPSYLNQQNGRIWLCRRALIESHNNSNVGYLQEYFDRPPVTSRTERIEVTIACLAYAAGYKMALEETQE
jgi:hypothetical protein